MKLSKRVLPILLSLSLMSFTGCSENNIKRNNNKDSFTYTGNIDIDGIDDLYIVELTNLKNETELYLTYRTINTHLCDEYTLLGTDINIIDHSCNNKSTYGIVTNIIPFNQFLTVYGLDLKEVYRAKEIIDTYDKVKNEYNELLDNKNVKKLELKK